MTKFGTLKNKMLSKLTESYSKDDKSEIKDILKTIKENKDFKEMYLFYEEIENKYIEDKETAKLYVEGIGNMLSHDNQKNKFFEFCETLDKKIGDVEVQSNGLYESLDQLSEKETLSNIESRVVAKRKIIDHLTTKKEVVQVQETTFTDNQNLLHAVLVNNFNVLYTNNLNEEQKDELKTLLSLSNEDVVTKTNELKESIISSVSTLLNESNDSDLTSKLSKVKDEVTEMTPSRYNLHRLSELKNGLN
jgi:hypothetical protein